MKSYIALENCIVQILDNETGDVLCQFSYPTGSVFSLSGYNFARHTPLVTGAIDVQTAGHTRDLDQLHPVGGDTAAVQTYLPSPAQQQKRMIEQITSSVLARTRRDAASRVERAADRERAPEKLEQWEIEARELEERAAQLRTNGAKKRRLSDDKEGEADVKTVDDAAE